MPETSSRSLSGARATMGISLSPSLKKPTLRPEKLVRSACARSSREMPRLGSRYALFCFLLLKVGARDRALANQPLGALKVAFCGIEIGLRGGQLDTQIALIQARDLRTDGNRVALAHNHRRQQAGNRKSQLLGCRSIDHRGKADGTHVCGRVTSISLAGRSGACAGRSDSPEHPATPRAAASAM